MQEFGDWIALRYVRFQKNRVPWAQCVPVHEFRAGRGQLQEEDFAFGKSEYRIVSLFWVQPKNCAWFANYAAAVQRGAMIAASKLLAFIALCLAFCVSGCEQRSWTYRYRLTIDVETPEGVRTGSSVIEVNIKKAPVAFLDLSNGAIRVRLRGEATVVDLGPRGVLFALMLGGNARIGMMWGGDLPTTVFTRLGLLGGHDTGEQNWSKLETLAGKTTLLPEEIPFLVRFTDPGNPKSMTGVYPDDLEASFGRGVRIRQATIEMTHDRPTDDIILEYLPWLRSVSDNYYIIRENMYKSVDSKIDQIQKPAFRWGVK